MELLSVEECRHIYGGAAPALTVVIAVGAIAVILVAVYKLYQSATGEVNLGGGIKFKWDLGND